MSDKYKMIVNIYYVQTFAHNIMKRKLFRFLTVLMSLFLIVVNMI